MMEAWKPETIRRIEVVEYWLCQGITVAAIVSLLIGAVLQ